MNNEKIIEILQEYKDKQGKVGLKKLEKKRKQIELRKRKQELKINITQNYSEGTRTNKIESSVENTVINKDEKIKQLEEEIEQIDNEIELLEIDIEEVNIRLGCLNYLEKEIMVAYYVDNLSMKEIGEITYYNVRRQTRGRKAIKKIIEKTNKKMQNL